MYEQLSEKTIPISQKEYKVDPDLGWVPRENVRYKNDQNQWYTTNSLGFRSLKEFEVDDDERFTVLIVGDSYTYGSWAGDQETWPTILQNLDDHLQVLNMAVGGYGTDQMYLMLQRHIAHFKPDLVIAAFIDDNLHRSMLSFRDFQKPKFEIDEGALVLTNTPIPAVEDVGERVRRELKRQPLLTEVCLINLVLNVYAAIVHQPARRREAEELNDLILGEMIEFSAEHHTVFLLLYLPHGDELIDPAFNRFGERYFEQFVERSDIHGINPRPLFLASEARYSMGHYRRRAATVVAHAVYEKIATLPSFSEEQ